MSNIPEFYGGLEVVSFLGLPDHIFLQGLKNELSANFFTLLSKYFLKEKAKFSL